MDDLANVLRSVLVCVTACILDDVALQVSYPVGVDEFGGLDFHGAIVVATDL
jgi:hypothetical protein